MSGSQREERLQAVEPAVNDLDAITGDIVQVALDIHRRLGPGLLESVYEKLTARALRRQGYHVERQRRIGFRFDGMTFDPGFRVDLLVNGLVVIEVKSVEALAPVHAKQVLTYLRLLDLRVGLILNFGGATMKEGLRRIVNRYVPGPNPALAVNRSRRAAEE